jgi:hypothetical protein
MPQNVVVLQDGDKFKVYTDFTRDLVGEAARADEAIQGAIDALAGPGGVATLGRGVFPLAQPVRLADNVHLRGSSRGTRLRVTAENREGVGLICRAVQGARISDLSVTGGNAETSVAGIVVDDAMNCQVRDVFAAGFGQYGVWVRNNSFLCEVSGSTLAGNRRANLYMDDMDMGRYGDFVPNLVSNCTIYGGGKGIECRKTIVLNIVGCAVYQTGDVGYHLHSRSNSVAITGCRSFQITGPAVLVEDTHELNLTGNIFCWHTDHGVIIRDCYWGTISGNNVIDTGSLNTGAQNFTVKMADAGADAPNLDGIRLESTRGFNVTGNTIFNWSLCPPMRYGVYEDASSFNNTITGNNVNYYVDAAVHAGGKGTETCSNVGYGDRPYDRMDTLSRWIQTFRPELTARFIEEQMG